MTTTIIPASRSLPAEPRLGPVTRQCRATLHRWLAKLDAGRLTLVDNGDTDRFGTCHQPDTADAPACTIRVHHPRFYRDAVLGGHLAAAEGYVHGLWDCDDLTALVRLFARNLALSDDMDKLSVRLGGVALKLGHWLRRNTARGSRDNIAAHYDLGNEFFQQLLDPTMSYSAGVFENAQTPLEAAQHAKIDRLLRKINLKPTDHLLEIGTGWGGLALHAVKHYGCRVTTTTLSKQQHDYAHALFKREGVADHIELLQRDYRELDGRYSKIVSVEMIEAVGHQYYKSFFSACDRLLDSGGRGVIQCITIPDARYATACKTVDFIKKYIFPGSCIPSTAALNQAMRQSGPLRMSGLEDLTPHYATTLDRWRQNMEANRDAIKALGYPETLLRMWAFYLAYCEGGFRERNIGLAQFEFVRQETAK
ncbi:MAG: class I SAM-dependent methyltransferase [Phycisphaerales bacterium JB063]